MNASAQLDLFGTQAQRALEAEVEWLRASRETAIVEFRKLREERDQLQEQCDRRVHEVGRLMLQLHQLQNRLEAVTLERECWRNIARMGESSSTTPPRGPQGIRGPALDQELRRLLSIAHPDKWSAGQPVTDLAHELTITINALRERLGGAA